MDVVLPPSADRLPLHRRRMEAAARSGMADSAILGMILGGSFASGQADRYSDVDLQFVVGDGGVDELVPKLRWIAEGAGPLVAAFSAEHIGLPHMLITLYEDLIHVDFEPVEVSSLGSRNAGLRTHVLWERDPAVSRRLGQGREEDRARELAWLEDRVWTWSWYVQTKILRGELYEALAGIQYLRDNALFRLVAMHNGEATVSARRIEARAIRLYVDLADPLLRDAGVPSAGRARVIALRALDDGLRWAPQNPVPGGDEGA